MLSPAKTGNGGVTLYGKYENTVGGRNYVPKLFTTFGGVKKWQRK